MLAGYAEKSRKADATNLAASTPWMRTTSMRLNNDQRIILASHRFAPEVTSAALWLNEKAPG